MAAECLGELPTGEATAPFVRSGSLEATGASLAGGGEQTQGATGFLLRVHGGGAHPGHVPEGCDDLHSHMLDAAPRARLTEEERLEREVARRREMELERRLRIFDAKRRTIGIDKQTLDQQCAENEERRKQEKHRERAEDRHVLGLNRILQMNENENRKIRHEMEKECKMYSLEKLNFESRREFDINDPKAVTKGAPTRLGDDDPRCGPASMQQFNGEDLLKHERDRQQKTAVRSILEQQVFEKEMLKRLDHDGGADYARTCQDMIDLRNEVETSEAALRKEIMGGYQQELKDKMRENFERKQQESLNNQEMNQRELDFHASDEFLNETRSNRRPDGQLSKDSYKGSTRDERIQVFGDQLAQCEDNANRKYMEGVADLHTNRSQEFTRKQLVMMEREKQRMKRAMAMEVAAHNQGMHTSQKETAKILGRDAHRNHIDASFFEQFGTTTR